jgi:hypothetical protein
VINTFGTIPGIVGVYFTGFILNATHQNWHVVFLSAASLQVVAVVFYAVLYFELEY